MTGDHVTPMIQVRDLTKYYDNGQVKALNGLRLSIAQGSICAIMGPSASGKSTLLNLIGSLDEPTSGEVIIDGTPINIHQPLDRYRHHYIGFIFQLHNLLPTLTLLENVELPMHANKSMSRQQRRNKAWRLLEDMQLEDRADSFPVNISGGERQRVAVVRAFANDPKIILADEPTGSVDSRAAGYIIDAILSRCRQKKMTALIVTHDFEVAKMTDRIFQMRDGVLI